MTKQLDSSNLTIALEKLSPSREFKLAEKGGFPGHTLARSALG